MPISGFGPNATHFPEKVNWLYEAIFKKGYNIPTSTTIEHITGERSTVLS